MSFSYYVQVIDGVKVSDFHSALECGKRYPLEGSEEFFIFSEGEDGEAVYVGKPLTESVEPRHDGSLEIEPTSVLDESVRQALADSLRESGYAIESTGIFLVRSVW